jgi:hypothetical protein
MPRHFMNKAQGAHISAGMGEEQAEPIDNPMEEKAEPSGGHENTPQIHIHTHSGGHSVHVHHKDGKHTEHKFKHGDHEAVGRAVAQHMGGSKESASGDGMEESAMASGQPY